MKTNKNSITNGSLALKQVAKEKNYIGMISGFFSLLEILCYESTFLLVCALLLGVVPAQRSFDRAMCKLYTNSRL
jgi:hypothetical protein